jgi:predicted DNA binding CopG/RHH family protein
MGIKDLNKLLKERCNDNTSIKKIHIQELKGKSLVIDTMNYLYKFKAENALMENMFIFISSFLRYDIHPIFIFDGKPPPEKRAILKQRRLEKKMAEEQYNILKQKLDTTMDEKEQKQYMTEMEKHKRNFTRINEEDIAKIKSLMDAYGVIYYDAEFEADELCMYFVQSKLVWGCMSDDMDMLLYDCPYILRNLSLLHQTIWIYDKNAILNDLDMTYTEFSHIIVLAGTYNIQSNITLEKCIVLWKQYNRRIIDENQKQKQNHATFYEWLSKDVEINIEMMENIITIFSIIAEPKITLDKNAKKPNLVKIKELLDKEGFLFI